VCACVSFKHSITISRSKSNNNVEKRRKNLMKIINKVVAIKGRIWALGGRFGGWKCNQVYDEPRKLRLQMFVWLK